MDRPHLRAGLVLLLVAALPAQALAPPQPQAQESQEDCARGAPLPPCNRWASRLPLGPANEVHVAANPLDPGHLLVVAKDYGLGRNGDCRPAGAFHVASASYVTRDGGHTWRLARVPAPYPGAPEPSPLPYLCGSDPVAAFGPDGTAYYILLNFQYTGGRQAAIAVARSPDGGETWPAGGIRVLHTSPGNDKEWGTVGPDGRVHVVWSDFSAGQVMYARSSPDFVFEAPRGLATIGSGNPGVQVAAGPGGEVYVVWRDGPQIRLRRSLDAGATFEAARVAFTAFPYETPGPPRLPFLPSVAVDRDPASPFAGRLYVAWPDTRERDASVWLASSGDGGLTWTPAVRVDDNPRGGKRQVLPAVSVAPGGRVDVAWLDERDQLPFGALGPGSFRAYASSSLDGGATWAPNRAVSEVPLVSAWSKHQDGSVFVGDYMGVASTPGFAWPAFPGNGLDRALEGLPSEAFMRADAYTAPVDGAALLGDARPARPLEGLASVVVGDAPFGVNDPAAPPFLD